MEVVDRLFNLLAVFKAWFPGAWDRLGAPPMDLHEGGGTSTVRRTSTCHCIVMLCDSVSGLLLTRAGFQKATKCSRKRIYQEGGRSLSQWIGRTTLGRACFWYGNLCCSDPVWFGVELLCIFELNKRILNFQRGAVSRFGKGQGSLAPSSPNHNDLNSNAAWEHGEQTALRERGLGVGGHWVGGSTAGGKGRPPCPPDSVPIQMSSSIVIGPAVTFQAMKPRGDEL